MRRMPTLIGRAAGLRCTASGPEVRRVAGGPSM